MSDERTVSRKIQFYKVFCGREPNGQLTPYPHENLLSELKKLGNSPGALTIEWDEVHNMACQVMGSDRLRIEKLRKDDLPRKVKGKELKESGYDEDEMLSENFHLIFFGKNVVGAEYNHHGAKVEDVPKYFRRLFDVKEPPFHILEIARKDAFTQIHRLKNHNLLDIKFFATDLAGMDNGGEFEQALSNFSSLVSGEGVECELVVRSKAPLPEKIWTILNLPLSFLSKRTSSMKVRGKDIESGKSDIRDLCQQLITTRYEVVKLTGLRSVSSESVFEKIEESYEAMKSDIDAGIVLELNKVEEQ